MGLTREEGGFSFSSTLAQHVDKSSGIEIEEVGHPTEDGRLKIEE